MQQIQNETISINNQTITISAWETDEGLWTPDVRNAETGQSVYVGGEDDEDDATPSDAIAHGVRLANDYYLNR